MFGKFLSNNTCLLSWNIHEFSFKEKTLNRRGAFYCDVSIHNLRQHKLESFLQIEVVVDRLASTNCLSNLYGLCGYINTNANNFMCVLKRHQKCVLVPNINSSVNKWQTELVIGSVLKLGQEMFCNTSTKVLNSIKN